MTKRKKPKTDAAPAIGDRLLTLREAADVLRLSTRTMRDYVRRGEIEGRIIGDPLTLVMAVVTLSAVAALASFLPAYRASKLDPLTALRYE